MSYIVEHFLSPLYDLKEINNANFYLNSYPHLRAFRAHVADLKPDYQFVQGVAQDKLRQCITELGFNPERIQLLINTSKNTDPSHSSFYCHGSLKEQVDTALIFISPKVLDAIESEFTADNKFALAHEICHLIMDDMVQGSFEKKVVLKKVHLIAYVVTMAVLSFFSPDKIFTNHSLSLILATVGEKIISDKMSQQKEDRCDRWAAMKSPEIAAGGILFFEKEQAENLKREKAEKEKIKSPSFVNRTLQGTASVCTSIYYAIFRMRPHASDNHRIAAISAVLAKKETNPEGSLFNRFITFLKPATKLVADKIEQRDPEEFKERVEVLE